MSKFRILSIDGGGIRGLYSLAVLSSLEKEVSLFDHFDVFSGTSTGSIIALGLSLKMTAKQILDMYIQLGAHIFVLSDKKQSAKYDHALLKQALSQSIFPKELKLETLDKKVVIPTFKLFDKSLQRWAPCLYHNFKDGAFEKESLLDIALASCSAPIYFSSYQGYLDGGVFAPNPSMHALTCAIDPQVGKRHLQDVYLLSIGSGLMPLSIQKEINWDSSSWAFQQENKNFCEYPLFTMMVDAMAESVDKQCLALLGQRYYRINSRFDEMIEIDEYQKGAKLIEKGLQYPNIELLKGQLF